MAIVNAVTVISDLKAGGEGFLANLYDVNTAIVSTACTGDSLVVAATDPKKPKNWKDIVPLEYHDF